VAREAAGGRALVNVVRYADDFVVTARTPELLAGKIIPAVTAFLAERVLELSDGGVAAGRCWCPVKWCLKVIESCRAFCLPFIYRPAAV
jgi:hypothetical protein